MTPYVTRGHSLVVSMHRQKGPQIAFGNPHYAPEPMRHEVAGLDPPTNGTDGNVEMLRHVGNREELDGIALTRHRMVFVPAHRSAPYSEVERTGLPIFNSAKVLRSGGA
jgi:hypothetical protein